jgi:hypothetical protein
MSGDTGPVGRAGVIAKNSVFSSERQMRRELKKIDRRRSFVDVYQHPKTKEIEYACFGYTGYDMVRRGKRLAYRIRIKP